MIKRLLPRNHLQQGALFVRGHGECRCYRQDRNGRLKVVASLVSLCIAKRLKDRERGSVHRVHERLDTFWSQDRRFSARSRERITDTPTDEIAQLRLYAVRGLRARWHCHGFGTDVVADSRFNG